MYDERERYWIALAQSPGLSARAFYAVLSAARGDPVEVWRRPEMARPHLTEQAYARFSASLTASRANDAIERLRRAEVMALTHLSDDFPEPLRFIEEPPPVIYLRGRADAWLQHAVAVVGTRTPSRDGLRASFDVARGLAENGVMVVSGMALGIDRAAHEGCLAAEGRTVAVLGSGPDVNPSYEARDLADRIVRAGGTVLSEYPPGMPAYRWSFPRRNRIIAGLTSGVALVEGESDSGALITLGFARKFGRVRFAMPGSIYAANSQAPNALLRDGAVAVTCGEDILRYFGWSVTPHAPAPVAPPLVGDEGRVVECLRKDELSFDELAARTGLVAAKLNTLLTILELRGIIKQLPGRRFRAALNDTSTGRVPAVEDCQ